jgi:hypothetical protein
MRAIPPTGARGMRFITWNKSALTRSRQHIDFMIFLERNKIVGRVDVVSEDDLLSLFSSSLSCSDSSSTTFISPVISLLKTANLLASHFPPVTFSTAAANFSIPIPWKPAWPMVKCGLKVPSCVPSPSLQPKARTKISRNLHSLASDSGFGFKNTVAFLRWVKVPTPSSVTWMFSTFSACRHFRNEMTELVR